MGVSGHKRLPPTFLAVLGLLILQAVWIAVVPPFRGIDEIDHVYRAAGVAGGEWRLDEQPEHGRGLLVWVPSDIVEAAQEQCEELPYTLEDNCHSVDASRPGYSRVATAAATYNPALYWLLGTVAEPFQGVGALYAMRLCAAGICAAMLGLGISLIRRTSDSPVVRVGVLCALTPVFLYTTTVPSPNGLEMAVGFLLWATVIALGKERGRREARCLLLLSGICSFWLCVLRPLGPMWCLLIVAVGALSWESGRLKELVRSCTNAALLAATSALLGAAFNSWWMLTNPPTSEPVAAATDDNVWQSPVWTLQMIAAFPFRNEPAPTTVYVIWGMILAIVFAAALYIDRNRARFALAAGIAITFALPLVFSILTKGQLGVIWQGRYSLPFSVGLPVLSALSIASAKSLARIALVLLLVLLGVCHVWSQAHVLSRMGADPVWGWDGSGWSEPSAVLVVVCAVAGWFAIMLWALRSDDLGDPPARTTAEANVVAGG